MSRRQFARGSAIQGTGWGISLVLQAAHFAIAARFLTTTEFAAYVAALAVYGITGALSEFGLQQTAVLAFQASDEARVVRASSVAALLLGAGSLAVAIIVTGLALPGSVHQPALFLVPAFVIARAELPFQALRQHRLQFGRVASAEVAGRAVAVGTLGAVALGADSWTTTGRFAATGLSLAVGLLVTVVLLLGRPVAKGDPSRGESLSPLRLIAEAVPLGLTNAASFVHVRIDQVILAAYGVTVALADYAIAYRLLDAAVALVSAVGMVALPLLARRPRSERAQASRELGDLLVVLAVVLGMLAFVFAPQLVLLLGGPRYTYATWLARLLTPALVVSVLNVSGAQVAIVERNASALLRIAVLAVVVNVVLNVVFIPSYGVRASAVATVVTETIGAVLVARLSQSLLPGSVDWRGMGAAMGGFLIAAFGGLAAWREVSALAGCLVGAAGVCVALLPLLGSARRAAVSWQRRSAGSDPVPGAF
jgi:O-antigen/teichoic acid export membrane protein